MHGHLGLLDGAKLALVLLYIVIQRHQQSFGVDGIHDDTATHIGVLGAGQHLGKIEYNLSWRMRDNGQIAVHTLRHFDRDIEVQIRDIVILFHSFFHYLILESDRDGIARLYRNGDTIRLFGYIHVRSRAYQDILVLAETRTGGDEMSHDNILLHTLQEVLFGVDGRLGKHLGRLLEGGSRDE